MKKNDLNKLLKKYEPVVKKTGERLAKAAKTAEKDIAKMYNVAQAHIEIQMKHLQKEKIYHEIGKDISKKLIKDEIDIPGLDKYKKRLASIEVEEAKMKKRLSKGKKTKKKK